MIGDNYWVGVRHDNGAMWLYDPSLQHDDPDMIYAYYVNQDEMREYEKEYVKKMLSTATGVIRDAVIMKYLEWYEKHGEGFVDT